MVFSLLGFCEARTGRTSLPTEMNGASMAAETVVVNAQQLGVLVANKNVRFS
jgi:hypothetical protein